MRRPLPWARPGNKHFVASEAARIYLAAKPDEPVRFVRTRDGRGIGLCRRISETWPAKPCACRTLRSIPAAAAVSGSRSGARHAARAWRAPLNRVEWLRIFD